MTSKQGRTQTTVRLEKELLKAVQRACIDRDTNQTEAIEEGLRLWLEVGPGGKEYEKLQTGVLPGESVADSTISTVLAVLQKFQDELNRTVEVWLNARSGPRNSEQLLADFKRFTDEYLASRGDDQRNNKISGNPQKRSA